MIVAVATIISSVGLTAQTDDPQKLFQEAVGASERGDDATAVRKYQELLRAHPDAVAVRVNLGATLTHLKHFDEAIEQDRIVLKTDPRNRLARMNLGVAYEAKGALSAAIDQFERLHYEDVSDGDATKQLADCYTQAGRDTDALALLQPIEQAHTDDPEFELLLGKSLIHTGHAREGAARLEQASERTASADGYLLAGQTRFNLAQYDLARQDVDAVRRLNPKLAGLQTLDGMILERTADYDGAREALERAILENPRDYDAHFYLGAIFYFKRDMEKARAQLLRALQLKPESVQARYELALVARANGQLDEALKQLQTVVRASPDWMQPHVELSALYYKLNRPVDGAKEKDIVDRMMMTQQQQQSIAAR